MALTFKDWLQENLRTATLTSISGYKLDAKGLPDEGDAVHPYYYEKISTPTMDLPLYLKSFYGKVVKELGSKDVRAFVFSKGSGFNVVVFNVNTLHIRFIDWIELYNKTLFPDLVKAFWTIHDDRIKKYTSPPWTFTAHTENGVIKSDLAQSKLKALQAAFNIWKLLTLPQSLQ